MRAGDCPWSSYKLSGQRHMHAGHMYAAQTRVLHDWFPRLLAFESLSSHLPHNSKCVFQYFSKHKVLALIDNFARNFQIAGDKCVGN